MLNWLAQFVDKRLGLFVAERGAMEVTLVKVWGQGVTPHAGIEVLSNGGSPMFIQLSHIITAYPKA